MMRFLLPFLFLCFSLPALAITHPNERLPDPGEETRAIEITKTLRCVVCQNESIEESRADMARDLRLLVRQQITAGKTNAEIHNFLQERYGDFIFLEPPVTPRTWLLWGAPLLVIIIGGLMISTSMRRRRRHH